jgi:hypothetical protein
MNRAVHSTATEQTGVGRVHDRIDFKLRDVTAHDVQLRTRHFTLLAFPFCPLT